MPKTNTLGTILVSGAGIAGPAVAWWLTAAGWDVTVVERFPRPRDGGQNVDVRGTGREVLRKMGLEDAVRAHHTQETGTSFIADDGTLIASLPAHDDDTGSPTADLEILRGQLCGLLYQHSRDRNTYLFDDRITALDDDGHGVHVQFAHGPQRRFDAVIIAEGARSSTRDMVMPHLGLRELGLLWTYLTIPRTEDDDRQWRMHMGGRGRLAHLRPDNHGTTRAMLSLRTNARGLHLLDHPAIISVLRATFADMGWETPRILATLDQTPLYVDAVAQVHLPVWHTGRVVLLGDTAWNAGPFGTGTTSALTGAYVLAGEMTATPDDPTAAFTRYEHILRPLTDAAQRSVPWAMHPYGQRRKRLLTTGLRILGSPLGTVVSRIPGIAPSLPVSTVPLPHYPALQTAAAPRD